MPKKNSRDDFSVAVVRALRDRVGGKCSQPECRKATVGPDPSTETGITITGNAAHICAASLAGPRYDPRQSRLERSSIRNGIWLCGTCALLVDKNGGRNFTVETLRKWKAAAEKEAAKSLLQFAASMERPSWLKRLITLHYANIARLQMWDPAAFSEVHIGPEGFGDGFIAPLLLAARRAIEAADIQAIPLSDVLPPSAELVGTVISFHARCFTKNGQRDGAAIKPQYVTNFSLDHSPHFYIKAPTTRVLFPYDPKWITTNTARAEFNSGQQRFAGLGLVKSVADDLSAVVASPLLVGLASDPSLDFFYGIGPDR